MKNIKVDLKGCHTTKEQFESQKLWIEPAINKINEAKSTGYESEFASINLASDKKTISEIETFCKGRKPEIVIVVGIGGSNLGTIAVHEAINGKKHNELRTPKAYFLDTVDPDSFNEVKEIIVKALKQKKEFVVNIISKSGTTTETIANTEALLEILRRKTRKPEGNIIITTDKGSKLWDWADRHKIAKLEIPKTVGGRYSVFSAVGLLPLKLLGININSLLKGAEDMKKSCLGTKIHKNPAALSAISTYEHYKAGRIITDMFLFSNDLESVGKWNRQLVAESLGKEHNMTGRKVNNGPTPTVSIGSTDLHSMAQLYIGGPDNKIYTIISLEKFNHETKIPSNKDLKGMVPGIQGKTFGKVMNAIIAGFKKTLSKRNRPVISITLPSKNEYTIGQLLQFRMIETMYLGYLMHVNPFDQPNVEEYKAETRKILSGR